MKQKIFILVIGISIVLAISLFVFNFQSSSLTGFAISNEVNSLIIANTYVLFNVSFQDALNAINDSYLVMEKMKEDNFSVEYLKDTLIAANMVFEQAKYAQILRGEISADEKQKLEAANALRLVEWKNITFGSVLFYTDIIQQRKEQAYLILDRITLANNNLEGLSNATTTLLEKAKIAFDEERYNDTQILLDQFRTLSEQEKARAFSFRGLKKGIFDFFQKYWLYILIAIFLLTVVGYFLSRKLKISNIKKTISKMKIEKDVLMDLMKQAQEERFKKNSISGLVYNIRLKKYQERLEEIKQDLPVLEAKFEKIS